MKQDERTPGPWRQSTRRAFEIYRGVTEDEHVATCFGSTLVQSHANAAFIVQAVNAYTSTDALRSALAEGRKAAVELARKTEPCRMSTLTEAQIRYLVDRFLMWKLPKTFSPDGGISFERIAGADGPHPFTNEPSGTNLLCATEATEMVRHMLEGLPGGSPAPSTEGTPSASQLADMIPEWMAARLLRGERAIEASEFRQRDEIIAFGLARRAWPNETGDAWQTWLTPLGVEVRDLLAKRNAARTALAGS